MTITKLNRGDLKELKDLNLKGLKELLKEYYKDSIILNNSDLKKNELKIENTFTTSGCSFFGITETFTYEDAIISIYKLEQISDKLK